MVFSPRQPLRKLPGQDKALGLLFLSTACRCDDLSSDWTIRDRVRFWLKTNYEMGQRHILQWKEDRRCPTTRSSKGRRCVLDHRHRCQHRLSSLRPLWGHLLEWSLWEASRNHWILLQTFQTPAGEPRKTLSRRVPVPKRPYRAQPWVYWPASQHLERWTYWNAAQGCLRRDKRLGSCFARERWWQWVDCLWWSDAQTMIDKQKARINYYY